MQTLARDLRRVQAEAEHWRAKADDARKEVGALKRGRAPAQAKCPASGTQPQLQCEELHRQRHSFDRCPGGCPA